MSQVLSDPRMVDYLIQSQPQLQAMGRGVSFFQAEDGIRDLTVTGVQTCALPISSYRKLQVALRDRGVLSSVVITILLLAFLVCPVVLLAGTLVGGIQTLAAHLKDGTPIIPPPPASIETWPVIGVPLKSVWSLASTNIATALRSFAPQIKAVVPWLLSASAGIGLTVLQFAFSMVVAAILLANARGAAGAAHSFATRIFGDQGTEFERLASSTIRSVATGILGVALIQSLLAALGFLVAGLPGAGRSEERRVGEECRSRWSP